MQLSKMQKTLLIAAIIISNVAVMGDYAVYPIVDGLYSLFGDQTGWVDTWVAMPQWVQVVFSFAAAALLTRMSTKGVLLLGGVCFTVGGLFGAIVPAIEFMTFMRFLFGVGIALVNVAGVSVLAQAFTDEGEYNKVMGWYNAGQALIGAGISALAGNLALLGWSHVFWIFIAAAAMTVMFAVFVPTLRDEEMAEEGVSGPTGMVSGAFWLAAIAVIVFSVGYAIASYYVSSYVIENGIGNETMAGYLGSVGTVGSFVFCLGYGKVYERMHRWVAVAAYGLCAVVFLLLAVAPGAAVAYVGYFLLGVGMGVCASYSYGIVPEHCSSDRVDFGIAVMTAVMCLGYAVASYFVSFLQEVTGTSLYTPMFLVAAVMALVACAIEVVSHAAAFQPKGACTPTREGLPQA